MEISFHKYQGTGNDFVMIDNRKNQFSSPDEQTVSRLCHRRLGIGADGLILLQNHPDFDFEMVYFNADGRLGSMCGNGARCTVQFARFLGVIETEARFLAADGPHEGMIREGVVHLKMGEVKEIEETEGDYYLDTGSPHYVQFVEGIEEFAVFDKGSSIRYNSRFREKGTNVNFAQQLPDALFVRTYERGVEDETLSCGTGVTATALAAHLRGAQSPVAIRTRGGNLQVAFDRKDGVFTNIFLIGPAVQVFQGRVEV
ncbi:diaminopimelate epimerase [soil metagenome]